MRRTIPLLATMALTLLLASGLVLAAGVGSAAADSSVVGPGESIQKAINAADPGDTIVVKGVHREAVVIRKDGIKLRGEDAVIEAPPRAKADSPCSKAFGLTAICVLGGLNLQTDEITGPRVRDVSVSGFTIRGFKDKDTFVIFFAYTRNATVEGNRITGNVASGIVADGSINTTIAKNHVVGSPETVNGIFLGISSRTKIVNNVVRNNVYGIDVVNSTNTTLSGNDSIGNGVDGFAVFDSPGTKIVSNVARRNEVVGIALGDTQRANAKVVGNNISGSPFGTYVVNAKGGSFAGNTIHDNCAGMFFEAFKGEPVGDFEVKANTVKDNTRSCRAGQFDRNFSGIGIALLGASGMEVKANNLSGNVSSGPTPVSGGVVVATNPYFGGSAKPKNNSVVANNFGTNRPDIYWDESGSGNSFLGNLCNMSVPSSLCN